MYTQEDRNRLAGLAGDSGNSKFPRYEVPELRFNGNTGEFRVKQFGSEEETPVTKPVSMVILKKMSMLSAYKTKESWFTSEFSSPNDRVALFHSLGGTVQFVEEGTPAQLRQLHQLLKTQAVLYVLFAGEVHRFVVKGGSLVGYFDHLKKLQDDEKHSFEIATVINSEKAKNEELGTTYYKMLFSSADSNVGVEELEAKMNEVNDAMKKIADYSASRQTDRQSASLTPTPLEKDPLADEFAKQAADEINPDDIPF